MWNFFFLISKPSLFIILDLVSKFKMTWENSWHWHYLLDGERSSSQLNEQTDLRSDTLTQVLQGYKYPLKTHTEFFLRSMDTHIHAHYNNPSDTSEQWHIAPAAVFKFSRGAAAGGDGTVSPPDATHVILACHPCQLNFNTLGRMWAEKQRSSWQTASSDPTFTANLPVKAVIHQQNILRFLNVYASLRQGCRLLQESMSPYWPLYPKRH